jgi:hypothetical protein
MGVFEDAEPCTLLDIDQHFRAAYCLHHQGDHYESDGNCITCYKCKIGDNINLMPRLNILQGIKGI